MLVGLHGSVRWSIGQAVGSIPAGIAAWIVLVAMLAVVRYVLDRSSGSPSGEGSSSMRSASGEVFWSISCNLAGGVLLPADERTDPLDDNSDDNIGHHRHTSAAVHGLLTSCRSGAAG